MISVFRRLRRNFLFQNRITRYLLYAFGEIILVMVGILLAIQVNDYRDEQALRGKEQFYLTNLKADIDSAIVEMNRVLERTEMSDSLSWLVVRLMAGDTTISDAEAVMTLVYNCQAYTYAAVSDGTIAEITYSGNLEIISNDTLRRFIVNWPERLEWMRESEELVKNSYYDNIKVLERFDDLPLAIFNKEPMSEKDVRTLLANTEFRNKISNYNYLTKGLSITYRSYISRFQRFGEALKAELK